MASLKESFGSFDKKKVKEKFLPNQSCSFVRDKTNSSSKDKKTKVQKMTQCLDCFDDKGIFICLSCAKKCHSDHSLGRIVETQNTCYCGKNNCQKRNKEFTSSYDVLEKRRFENLYDRENNYFNSRILATKDKGSEKTENENDKGSKNIFKRTFENNLFDDVPKVMDFSDVYLSSEKVYLSDGSTKKVLNQPFVCSELNKVKTEEKILSKSFTRIVTVNLNNQIILSKFNNLIFVLLSKTDRNLVISTIPFICFFEMFCNTNQLYRFFDIRKYTFEDNAELANIIRSYRKDSIQKNIIQTNSKRNLSKIFFDASDYEIQLINSKNTKSSLIGSLTCYLRFDVFRNKYYHDISSKNSSIVIKNDIFGYYENLKYKLLEMYAAHKYLGFGILVPLKEKYFVIDQDKIKKYISKLEQKFIRTVIIPEFERNIQINLSNLITKNNIFPENNNPFGKTNNTNLSLTTQINFKVNLDNMTKIEMSREKPKHPKDPIDHFFVNKSFIYYVRDRSTNNFIFLGKHSLNTLKDKTIVSK